jgi:DNA-binding MarR family transcriptional regulator
VDVNWLDEQELSSWRRFIAVVERLPGVLDGQLRRDASLSHFEYLVLGMLSEAPERRLRMSTLAQNTNATLPRLSHVVSRLEARGLIERRPCPDDRRATNAFLTPQGWDKVVESAPGHVATVRQHVVDALTPAQLEQLGDICEAVLDRLDPQGDATALFRRPPSGGEG